MVGRVALRSLVALLAVVLVLPVAPAPTARAAELTTTDVASSQTPSTYGDAVTFTATVTPLAATGTVTFKVDDVALGAPMTVVDGVATSIAIDDLGVGTHTVTAEFVSDDPVAYDGSTGTLAGGQEVIKATLTVTPHPVALAYGSPEPAYSFDVSGFLLEETAGTAAGYVAPTCDSDYTTTTPVTSSPRSISCSGGSATSYAFSYGTASLTITKADQTVAFTSPAPVSATVGGPTYTPAASATSGLAVALTIAPASAAICSLGGGDVSFTGAGTCTVLGNQAGNGNWNPAPTAQQSFTVGQATTTTTVSSSANPSTYGAPVTFTATVTPATASGTVTIRDGGTALGTCTLSAGSCTFQTAALPAGTRSITAAYGGDGDHAGSTSSALSQQVSLKTLSVTGITAASRTYNGSVAAALTTSGAALVGVVAGDEVTLVTSGATGTFADKNVGAGKTVTVAGLTLGGADAGSYALVQPTATASISARSLTVTAAGVEKVYDRTTAATVTLADDRVGGDVLTTSYTSATFGDKNVGAGKTVTVTGIAISGADAGNYTANASTTTTASITARPLTVSATGVNRVYDGTTAATVTLTDNRVAGDALTVTYGAAAFANRNVGTGKTVDVSGIAIGGTDAGNYAPQNTTATATANITARPLTVTAVTDTKVYDGTTTSSGSPTVSGTLGAGDSAAWSQAFATATAGTAKSIVPAGAVSDGNGGLNYAVTFVPVATGTIGKKAATVTADPATRPYGSADPTFTATITGLVDGDVVGLPSCTTTPETPKAVGTWSITCTQGGLSTTNYTYTYAQGLLAVTPAPLTVTADDKSRAFGLANPTPTWAVTGFVLGETAATAEGFTGSPACTTSTAADAGVGAYPAAIECTVGSLTARNYAFTTFAPGTLTVVAAEARPVITADHNPSAASQPTTFTATVTWPTGQPTGTVTFLLDGTPAAGPLDLAPGGTASFTTSSLTVGDVAVTATYAPAAGVTSFAATASDPFTWSVGATPVDVALTSNRPTWETSVPITFSAVPRARASGVTIPVTGQVVFAVDGVDRATVAIVGGSATYASPPLAAGARTVTARYVRDSAAQAFFTVGNPGSLARTVVANTVNASGVGRSHSTFYPSKDGWIDTVAIRGTRNERISVSIKVYSPSGRRVRTKTYAAGTGAYSYAWNGRTSAGNLLAAGKYKIVQVLTDAYGARKTYTAYVNLSRKRMTWYSRTLAVAAGPRHFSVPGDSSIQSQFSTSSKSPLVLSNPTTGALKWLAVGYQFTLPSATTYTSLSFQVQGSWTDATTPVTRPKIGLVPWSGGDWGKAMYSGVRPRVAMGTSAASYYAHTITNLTGVRSGRYVRAVIDSYEPATGSGYAAGPFRYSITAVRLVVRYGILR